MSPDETALDLEWVALLDELEAATTATDAATPWSPPPGLPPVPGHLVARAQGVLERQRAAVDRVEAERRAALGQLGALRAVSDTAAPSRPVYLDASA